MLALLAEGHTAKSIATALDLSVHAVNERLREARRKTGAASSRELARRLASQESWDKQIGVSVDDPADAEPVSPGAAMVVRRRSRNLIIMLVTVAVFALGVVGVQNASAPTAAPTQAASTPAVSGAGVSRGAAPLDPHRSRFASEVRNSDWAAPAELRALALFTLVDGVRSVEVDCAATLCHVEGAVSLGAMKRARAGIQGDILRDRLAGAGLEVAAADFRIGRDAAEAGEFAAFLRRTD